ncbi:J domain-containing protein [Candidatus Vidania fulgoroideae]|uniref:J domain-containing protein n=1 Tax=Candidatus Vidania fulgoroideorum TaxID=881286 RepID=A0AAX3N8P9_9PROT|nr:J domain-containing protein [Candidatus Vidania fulgoroideae]WDR79482.1 J domain-containing protein [Candidatus Vidania fulgoroideae]
MKDYYSILGVSKEASLEEIKIAYKRLAMKYHPDRNKDSNSEEKFKEINEAYMTLSCSNKRAEYDNKSNYDNNYENNYHQNQNYYQNFNDFSYEDNSDKNYNINVEITLEESQLGTKKVTSIPINITCDLCRGLKFDPFKKTYKCLKCDGKGYELNNSFFIFQKTCSYCKGKGYFSKINCLKCNGIGSLNIRENIEVEIPKYVVNGEKIILDNVINNFNGKIIANIFIKNHEYFTYYKNNLHIESKIFFINFLLGKSFLIKTLINGKIRIKFSYFRNKKTFVINNCGLKTKDGICGNLYIHIKIEFPIKINIEQKKILKNLNKTFN